MIGMEECVDQTACREGFGCRNKQEIFAFMLRRESECSRLCRAAAQSQRKKEVRDLLERLARRSEAYLERLRESENSGTFINTPCNLHDNSFFSTIQHTTALPGESVPEIMMYAIAKKQEGFLVCSEAARQCRRPERQSLWQALAEEERTQRLELESYYDKEIIGMI